jgi:type IV pilus assembly protein PilW
MKVLAKVFHSFHFYRIHSLIRQIAICSHFRTSRARNTPTVLPRKMVGRSLVELMIALTLGMLVLLAVSSLFIGTRGTYRSLDDKSRLDEEGRLALHLLAHHIRMAGYGSLHNQSKFVENDQFASGASTVSANFPAMYTRFNEATSSSKRWQSVDAIRGCDNGFTNIQSLPSELSCASTNAGLTQSSAFMVRYEVDTVNGNATITGIPTDCLGNAIPETQLPITGGGIYIADNRFFIQNRPNSTTPELYCQGNGSSAAQPLAENVEQMNITYGLLAPDPNFPRDSVFTQTVARFVRATDVTNWNQVGSVRICLLVRSANNNVTTSRQTYRDCSDASVTSTDRRLRSAFITTIAIRSRVVGVSS